MISLSKILVASACAGALALGAVPALAAGPMVPTVKTDAVEKVEHRWDGRRGYWGWRHQPRYHYGPPYGRAYGYHNHHWRDRNHGWYGYRSSPYRPYQSRWYWNQPIR